MQFKTKQNKKTLKLTAFYIDNKPTNQTNFNNTIIDCQHKGMHYNSSSVTSDKDNYIHIAHWN